MKYLRDVVTLEYDQSRCTGCRRCTEVCPQSVFVMQDKRAVVTDRDACIECGACQRNCAFGAISVDAGVGCAAALINGILKYGNADKGTCDCGSGEGSCCG
jgi:NAD-dependent dihydropyrimidine dehydrogenase PreA subunit